MRKSIGFILLLPPAIFAAFAAYFWFSQPTSSQPPKTQTLTINQTAEIVPPPMETLGNGARMPTPEELEDEARYEDLQVAKATEWVNDSSVAKKVAGVEQLSAFPTAESERVLVNTLGLEFDPEVRRTAAQSLSAFKQPSEEAVNALLMALQEDSDAVQIESLNTLMVIAGRMESGSAPHHALLAKLSSQAKAKRMKAETRHLLRVFLQDQKAQPLMLGAKQ